MPNDPPKGRTRPPVSTQARKKKIFTKSPAKKKR